MREALREPVREAASLQEQDPRRSCPRLAPMGVTVHGFDCRDGWGYSNRAKPGAYFSRHHLVERSGVLASFRFRAHPRGDDGPEVLRAAVNLQKITHKGDASW